MELVLVLGAIVALLLLAYRRGRRRYDEILERERRAAWVERYWREQGQRLRDRGES